MQIRATALSLRLSYFGGRFDATASARTRSNDKIKIQFTIKRTEQIPLASTIDSTRFLLDCSSPLFESRSACSWMFCQFRECIRINCLWQYSLV
jgi:hypothetical protein